MISFETEWHSHIELSFYSEKLLKCKYTSFSHFVSWNTAEFIQDLLLRCRILRMTTNSTHLLQFPFLFPDRADFYDPKKSFSQWVSAPLVISLFECQIGLFCFIDSLYWNQLNFSLVRKIWQGWVFKLIRKQIKNSKGRADSINCTQLIKGLKFQDI